MTDRVMEHQIHSELLKRQVRVTVVECGATGSAIATTLPFLHKQLLACGHPAGLHVTLIDGRLVSPHHCVAQPFLQQEVDSCKAQALAHRINEFWDLHWDFDGRTLLNGEDLSRADLVISCLDSGFARAHVDFSMRESVVGYWLDVSHSPQGGMFVLGEPLNRRNRSSKMRLSTVAELMPENTDLGDYADERGVAQEDDAESQMFTNQLLATHALLLISRLFRNRRVRYCGGLLNAYNGAVRPLGVGRTVAQRSA